MAETSSGLPAHLKRNEAELAQIRQLVASGNDEPVLMLNQNAYTAQAGYPEGELYQQYVSGLERLVEQLGGAILWRQPVLGQPVGEVRRCDEILAIWFPSHRAYLNLPSAEGGAENYRLRMQCVECAHIYRLPGKGAEAMDANQHATSRRIVQDFLGAVAAGDLPDEMLAPDMTAWATTLGTVDKAGYQNVVRILGQLTAGPLTFHVDAVTRQGDRIVAEVRSEGTLIDGNAYANTYVFVLRMENGRIAWVAEHYNPLIVQETLMPLMNEIGAAPDS
jgi:ketosteroid isomerase-like protein